MGKLAIMFAVGAIMAVIGVYNIFYTDLIKNPSDNLLLMISPLMIGVVLLCLSGHYGLRKFGRYMDRD